ncbi:MAG: DinB family protein [Weeksellaceae bacterium]
MIDQKYYTGIPAFFHYYFDLLVSDNLMAEFARSSRITNDLIQKIPVEKENFSYAPGKWTTKEVIRHIIDCERIYVYRAFRFSRFDNTPLPGFDEDLFIENLKGIEFSLSDLEEEFESVRKSTLSLYKHLTDKMLDFEGSANQVAFTARKIGFMIVGHNLHHCNFIETNYLGIS